MNSPNASSTNRCLISEERHGLLGVLVRHQQGLRCRSEQQRGVREFQPNESALHSWICYSRKQGWPRGVSTSKALRPVTGRPSASWVTISTVTAMPPTIPSKVLKIKTYNVSLPAISTDSHPCISAGSNKRHLLAVMNSVLWSRPPKLTLAVHGSLTSMWSICCPVLSKIQ